MSGVLYIVATPIGNLDDITLRAIEVLRRVDLVAAEDTRRSRQLLQHLGIQQTFLSLHEHNERDRIVQLLEQLRQGRNIALVSDAGTPLISDPGYPLVNAVVAAGLSVIPIPGASSIITALSAAGLPTDHFCYHGFLSQRDAQRLQSLQRIASLDGTQVLLESSHRIVRLLKQIYQVSPDSRVVVCKELTKRYESFIRGDARECLQYFDRDPLLSKGEFVVLLHNPGETQQAADELQAAEILELLLAELALKQAVSLTVKLTGVKKNTVYKMALAMSSKDE